MLLDPTSPSKNPRGLLRTPAVNDQRRYLLLTGATGFLGQYLLRDLSLDGYRVAVLVRPSRKLSVRQRIELIMQRWEVELGIELPRPILLEGAITEERLGLSDQDFAWLEENIYRIVHSAAVVKFGDEHFNEVWRTNVEGTQRLIELSQSLNIEDFFYVSTAYSCGVQESIVYEHELGGNQLFRNVYEKSKFEAERKLRESQIKNVTIFRPSVIVGDSRTGFTSSYHGLFVYLRLIATLIANIDRDENGIAHTEIRLPISGYEKRNLVPVDWVSSVITKLIGDRKSHGLTFHLTPDEPTSPREIIEYCYNYFNSAGVEFAEHESAAFNSNSSEFAINFVKNTGMYHAYDKSDPVFDRSNLEQFAGDIPCPVIDQAMIHRFIHFGERDRWGKNPICTPTVAVELEDSLASLAGGLRSWSRQVADKQHPRKGAVGVNFVGRGGGQFTFERKLDDLEVKYGLHVPPDDVIEISMDALGKSLARHQCDWNAVCAEILTSNLLNDRLTHVA
ncbi:MAG TPA: SDR family oxidoreductase [Pirellulaceae bacterium]|nr:SDR family oxidoreductase [Pirellulaceae bacterium]HMO90891.1 SDR family oxidoreductase [Pirellulaceae bacterium]HMP68633.1 SDR family oxidoreductase [Pirellulaceae bacterium]